MLRNYTVSDRITRRGAPGVVGANPNISVDVEAAPRDSIDVRLVPEVPTADDALVGHDQRRAGPRGELHVLVPVANELENTAQDYTGGNHQHVSRPREHAAKFLRY